MSLAGGLLSGRYRRMRQPWRDPSGLAHGYPERIVDHAEERVESLARYAAARAG